jgi:hypothetical protein
MTSQAQPPGRPGPVPQRPMPPRPPMPTPGGGFAAPPPRPPVQTGQGPRFGPRHGGAPRPQQLSWLAVAAVVLGILVPPVGIVLGVLARRQIAASAAAMDNSVRLTGRPAATAGIVLGTVLTLAGAALAVVLLVVVPNGWLPSSDLSAASVQSTIEKTVPLPAGSVHCPGSLPAQLGASITCTGTQNNAPVSLKATVSSVNGRDVKFDITKV